MSNNVINTGKPIEVFNGGTGRATLTLHGVVVGQAAAAVNTTAAGTNGQALIGATGADPAFATLTSAGGTITFITGPNSLNLDVTGGLSTKAELFVFLSTSTGFITGDGTDVATITAIFDTTLFSTGITWTPATNTITFANAGFYQVVVQTACRAIAGGFARTMQDWMIVNGSTYYGTAPLIRTGPNPNVAANLYAMVQVAAGATATIHCAVFNGPANTAGLDSQYNAGAGLFLYNTYMSVTRVA